MKGPGLRRHVYGGNKERMPCKYPYPRQRLARRCFPKPLNAHDDSVTIYAHSKSNASDRGSITCRMDLLIPIANH